MPAYSDDELVRQLNLIAHDRHRATDHAQHLCYTALPTLSPSDIRAAEKQLGFDLPPLLRRLYTEVGNGGFGPGCGLLPLILPHIEGTVVDEYLQRRETPSQNELQSLHFLLPIIDNDCGVFICLLLQESGDASPPVVTYEPNLSSEESTRRYLAECPFVGKGLIPMKKSLHAWLGDWLRARQRN